MLRLTKQLLRVKTFPQPGVPESFKVLVKELQALALDIKRIRQMIIMLLRLKESIDYGETSFNAIYEITTARIIVRIKKTARILLRLGYHTQEFDLENVTSDS